MWKAVYKNQYKTSNPNLIITAVQSFPNMINTVEKARKEYEIDANQKDPIRLQISSLYWLDAGRDFIPLYLEDDCPKLKKLGNTSFIGPAFFWCIGYRNSAVTKWTHNSKSITHPPHKEYVMMLKHSLSNLNGLHGQYLFEQAVMMWVLESTEWQKSRRFKFIYNTSLKCLRYSRDERPIEKGKYLEFIEDMKVRDPYEFIFNEFL